MGGEYKDGTPHTKAVAPQCAGCRSGTYATCRVCLAYCCGNCVLTVRHLKTHT